MSFPRHICDSRSYETTEIIRVNIPNRVQFWTMNIDGGEDLAVIKFCPFCGTKLEVPSDGNDAD